MCVKSHPLPLSSSHTHPHPRPHLAVTLDLAAATPFVVLSINIPHSHVIYNLFYTVSHVQGEQGREEGRVGAVGCQGH